MSSASLLAPSKHKLDPTTDSITALSNMPSTFRIAPLIPGLVNEVVLEIFRHFVSVDRNGPCTLVLVCSAWRDRVLRSKSLQSLRRRRRNTALVENREKAGEGICIVSFDGGGPGSLSQLRMLDEIMLRLAFQPGVGTNELCPADYFDLMGGVGFGGLAALLLGRLRMTTMQAMEELATIGTAIFTKVDDMVTPEANLAKLRNAIEEMLARHDYPADIKLHDNSGNGCRVVLFAATAVIDHCYPFRTYPAPRKPIECTFVDAACATIATSEHFSPVAIGPRLRQQTFAGIPHGFDNPTREVVKEAQLVFGETHPVSLVLSLGSGQRALLSSSDRHVTRLSRIHCDGVARDLQYQWGSIAEHLRLNVDKGMEDVKLDDWSTLGLIETHTDIYLAMNPITTYIDKACQWLLQRRGSVTLGQLSGTKADCVVKVHSESLKDYMEMGFKQMHEVVQQLGIEKITLVDPIGSNIPIPMDFCLTFPMLLEVISVYFKHQKVPGSDFVERGDYRLVHGNRKIAMGPIKWTRIRKVGLKVEMSMILRTRNQNSTRCPGCRAAFEGSTIDEWAECLSCSAQFQIETHAQAEAPTQSDDLNQPRDANQSEGNLVVESIVSPGVSEAESGKIRDTKHTASSGEVKQLQFRLISVINFLEVMPRPLPLQTSHELLALLDTIFTEDSSNPNPALRELLDEILASNFLNDQLREPLLTQAAGRSMVGKLSGIAGYPQICLRRGAQSLYTLFLEQKSNKCLFCGSYKGVLSRAVGCVRKHLGHRPFVCDGVSCEFCDERSDGPARFYMSSLLQDHIKRRTQKIGCIHEDCNGILSRGNILRHWEARHAGTPFPYDVYNRYTRIESATSQYPRAP